MGVTYADPYACPACRGRIAGQSQCPGCGFVLSGPIAAELWRQLQWIDAVIASAGGPRPNAPTTLTDGRYADPYACPVCRGRIAGQSQCPGCGFALTGPPAADLWRRMQALDGLVARGRGASAPAAPAAPSSTASSAPPDPAVVPPVSGPQRRGVDVGSVILALGAVLLLVAATIFISVSWDRIGLFGRSMVLFAVTALAAAAAAEVSRRRLIGSAEALWSVTLGLLTLDWFAARAQGLADLDSVPRELHTGGWAVGLGVLGVLIAAATRGRFTRLLVMPQTVAGIAASIGAWPVIVYLGRDAGWWPFWAGAVGALIPALTAVLAWRLRTKLTAWTLIPVGLTVAPFLLVTAVYETAAHNEPSELALQGHALPLLSLSAAAALAAVTVPRGRAYAVCGALLGVAGVIIAGISGVVSFGAAMSASAVVAVAAAWWARADGVIARGVRFALLGYVVLGVQGLGVAWSEGVARPGPYTDPWSRIDGPEPLIEPLAVAALTLGLAGVCWTARRWLPAAWSGACRFAAAAVVVGGAPATGAALGLGFGVCAAVGLALAVGALIVLRSGDLVEAIGAGLVVPFTVLPAVSAPGLASGLLLAATAALAASAASTKRTPVVAVHAAAAVLSFAGASQAFVEARSLDERAAALALVLIAVACFGLACWAVEALPVRLTLESLAALIAADGVLTTLAEADPNWLALLFLLIALVLFAASLDVPDRRWAAIPAVVSAAMAWFCLIIGQQVHAVEVVTAPLAAVALGVGAWFMRGRPSLRTVWALGPGMLLAAVPSLPQALEDPTSARAWSLGAVSLVAAAIGWWRSWQAPFAVGAVVVGLLVVVNLWPVAMAVERWALFGVLGLLLLVIGVTWESRVRQGRAVVRLIGAMR